MPSLEHYVVLHQDRAAVLCFDRAAGWAERQTIGLDATIDLPALGIVLGTTTLYAGTGVR